MKINVCLYFSAAKMARDDEDYRALLADKTISKLFDWDALVTINHGITVGDCLLLVAEVNHRLGEGRVDVVCDVDLYEGAAAYQSDPDGWDLDSLSDEARLVLRSFDTEGEPEDEAESQA